MTDGELTEKVARAICIANADEDTPDPDEIWAKGFPAEGPAWTHFIREATAAIAAVREAEGPTANDLYYLRAINRRLAEFQEALDGIEALSIGGEALADERDWLDCYIDRLSRPFPTPPEDHTHD